MKTSLLVLHVCWMLACMESSVSAECRAASLVPVGEVRLTLGASAVYYVNAYWDGGDQLSLPYAGNAGCYPPLGFKIGTVVTAYLDDYSSAACINATIKLRVYLTEDCNTSGGLYLENSYHIDNCEHVGSTYFGVRELGIYGLYMQDTYGYTIELYQNAQLVSHDEGCFSLDEW